MTNKLVVIINNLKVPKIKKLLLYEMKSLVPNYSSLQNPWLGGYRPQISVLSVLNWIFGTPRTKFLSTPLYISLYTWNNWLTFVTQHSLNRPLNIDYSGATDNSTFRMCGPTITVVQGRKWRWQATNPSSETVGVFCRHRSLPTLATSDFSTSASIHATRLDSTSSNPGLATETT